MKPAADPLAGYACLAVALIALRLRARTGPSRSRRGLRRREREQLRVSERLLDALSEGRNAEGLFQRANRLQLDAPGLLGMPLPAGLAGRPFRLSLRSCAWLTISAVANFIETVLTGRSDEAAAHAAVIELRDRLAATIETQEAGDHVAADDEARLIKAAALIAASWPALERGALAFVTAPRQ